MESGLVFLGMRRITAAARAMKWMNWLDLKPSQSSVWTVLKKARSKLGTSFTALMISEFGPFPRSESMQK